MYFTSSGKYVVIVFNMPFIGGFIPQKTGLGRAPGLER